MNEENNHYPEYVQGFIAESGKDLPLHVIVNSALSDRQIMKKRVAKSLGKSRGAISQALKGYPGMNKLLFSIILFINRYDRAKEKRAQLIRPKVLLEN